MRSFIVQAVPSHAMEDITRHLRFLYGAERASTTLSRIDALFQDHLGAYPGPPSHAGALNHQDALLISYGNMVQAQGEPPLRTLYRFLSQHTSDALQAVHILPFFPYSSDQGFSVIDYRQVNPDLGDWEHVEAIAAEFRLMADMVINHVSAQSEWFQGFLAAQHPYNDYFITEDPASDLSEVVRPRDKPLLTRVETAEGEKHVWTTFSADQIDLNFQNPQVLLEFIDILLHYIRHGAQLIRLDAIAFLWKIPGTSSIHLPETHVIVKILRSVLEAVAPWVSIITETNVPHEENISYFGSGTDEAHMVYNFALPPLVLHTLLSGDASPLTAWAADLQPPSDQTTFFNFLASHDGIGLRPVEGLLTEEEIDALVRTAQAHGGLISYRTTTGGGKSPYEMNITYTDALATPEEWEDPESLAVDRFICSQAIMLSLAGLPAIYFHSLVGSRNDREGVKASGEARAINRERLGYAELFAELKQPGSRRARVFNSYRHLLLTRRTLPAFNPYGPQQVLDLGPSVVALARFALQGEQRVLCLHEITGEPISLSLPLVDRMAVTGVDRLSGERIAGDRITMGPYQTRWIELTGERT
jgi:sucrose phosphorylase